MTMWMLGAVALAQSGDAGEFSAFPCQDGWSACVQDGVRVDPEPLRETSGHLVPADMRVGWFDMEPTANFTPFVGLSEYSPVTAALPPPVAPPAALPTPRPRGKVGPDEPRKPEVRTPALPPVKPAVETQKRAGRTDASRRGTDAVQIPPPVGAPVSVVTDKQGPTDSKAGAREVVELETPVVCDDLTALEIEAKLGELSDPTVACLEGRLGTAARQTERNHVSRVLIIDRFGKNDRDGWANLLERHLEEIDASDPDLAYRFALHQQKRGKPLDAIRWADTALENRSVWTGSTYVSRVNGLYKLRAAAAQQRWQAAEARVVAEPNEANARKAAETRDRTKVMAREWAEYAAAAGKDATAALDLCRSAAATRTYCVIE